MIGIAHSIEEPHLLGILNVPSKVSVPSSRSIMFTIFSCRATWCSTFPRAGSEGVVYMVWSGRGLDTSAEAHA